MVASAPSSAGVRQGFVGALTNTARKYPEQKSEGNQTAARKVTSSHSPWGEAGGRGVCSLFAEVLNEDFKGRYVFSWGGGEEGWGLRGEGHQ